MCLVIMKSLHFVMISPTLTNVDVEAKKLTHQSSEEQINFSIIRFKGGFSVTQDSKKKNASHLWKNEDDTKFYAGQFDRKI